MAELIVAGIIIVVALYAVNHYLDTMLDTMREDGNEKRDK